MDVNYYLEQKIRQMAAGKLKCACGNTSWELFMYLGAGEATIAGCKVCGAVHGYVNEQDIWTLIQAGIVGGAA